METPTNSEMPTPEAPASPTPSKEENSVLVSILQMQEAQNQAMNKIIKDVEILKDAYHPSGTLDKITTQGIVLIILVCIVGGSFMVALLTGGVTMAISVFQALSLFETIIAVYFGLSFNLSKTGSDLSGTVIDQIQNAVQTATQKAT